MHRFVVQWKSTVVVCCCCRLYRHNHPTSVWPLWLGPSTARFTVCLKGLSHAPTSNCVRHHIKVQSNYLQEYKLQYVQSSQICVIINLRPSQVHFSFHVVVVVCGTHLWQDIAGSLTKVSWWFDNSRVASPTMMGNYGAPRSANPPRSPTIDLYTP